MVKHTEDFEILKEYYWSIEKYEKCTDIGVKAFMFWGHLAQINVNFHSFGKITLMDEELPIIQGWLNKLLANPYIPRKTRDMIAEESVKFASMIGSISNSHIDNIDSMNF